MWWIGRSAAAMLTKMRLRRLDLTSSGGALDPPSQFDSFPPLH